MPISNEETSEGPQVDQKKWSGLGFKKQGKGGGGTLMMDVHEKKGKEEWGYQILEKCLTTLWSLNPMRE